MDDTLGNVTIIIIFTKIKEKSRYVSVAISTKKRTLSERVPFFFLVRIILHTLAHCDDDDLANRLMMTMMLMTVPHCVGVYVAETGRESELCRR